MPFFTIFSDKHFLHVTIIDNLAYKITTNPYISLSVKTLKKVIGTDMEVVSNQDKQLYSDIEKAVKKEQNSQRDT